MKTPPFFEIGHRDELGSYRFTAEDIIDFASKYDPQPFHVDPEAARSSLFGGHCASGWHTASAWMAVQRSFAKRFVADWEAAGNCGIEYGPSPGFRNLRWLRPVFAGETIDYSMTTMECRPSGSRPGWHIITGLAEGFTQTSEPVIRFESSVFIRVTE